MIPHQPDRWAREAEAERVEHQDRWRGVPEPRHPGVPDPHRNRGEQTVNRGDEGDDGEG